MNTIEKNILTIRQGDVGLAPIAPPAKSKRGQPVHTGRVVIALGETTGHAHVIEGAVAEFIIGGRRVLWVEAPTVLTHQEHGKLSVAPGWYVIDDHQQEYQPAELPRRVLD